jgi:peptidoglycan DL-endopeptidase CwlO
VAAHRKPKKRPLTGQAGRTAATLVLAGAATGTASGGPVHAEPRLTAAQIKEKVDGLYEQAEAATEQYNGTKERADEARASLTELRDEAARGTDRLNTSRHELGSIAAAQYRSGGLEPAVQLALSSGPDDYLERAGLTERAGARQAAAVAGVRGDLGRLARLRALAGTRLAELSDRRAELARHKSTVEGKIESARKLLDRLTGAQRAQYDQQGPAAGAVARADRGTPPDAVPAPNARAGAAVAYAYGAIGRPYVWGATGPGSFDCSGLTQAAWRSAGVSLSRTSYTQINTGRRVTRSELAPGDLVFFYSGISHVGIYVGGGRMIHAPRPGGAVRVAPVDEMPFAGAARPV